MKRNSIYLLVVILLSTVFSYSQINFNDVTIEGWVGSGSNEVLFVVDFDSDSVGTDSTFAWGIRFDNDSVSGDSILSWISQADSNFNYDLVGSFLNNISYNSNSILYTNPDVGWFIMLESSDGISWAWNNGIQDKVGDQEWFGIVAMNTITYEAEINVPLVIGINSTKNDDIISFYPNPASDFVHITIHEPAKIRITDINSNVVKEPFMIFNNKMVDVSDFNAGIYILSIEYPERTIYKRLIIN